MYGRRFTNTLLSCTNPIPKSILLVSVNINILVVVFNRYYFIFLLIKYLSYSHILCHKYWASWLLHQTTQHIFLRLHSFILDPRDARHRVSWQIILETPIRTKSKILTVQAQSRSKNIRFETR